MKAKFVFENIEFKRGADPKTSMGLGEYAYIAKWWDKVWQDHNEKVDSELLFKLTLKMCRDFLDGGDGWTRGDSGQRKWDIVNREMETARLQKDYIGLKIAVDDNGDIYLRGEDDDELKICPEVKAGNLSINPGDVINKIIQCQEKIAEENRKEEIRKQKEEFQKDVDRALYTLKYLGVLDYDITNKILKNMRKILNTKFDDE